MTIGFGELLKISEMPPPYGMAKERRQDGPCGEQCSSANVNHHLGQCKSYLNKVCLINFRTGLVTSLESDSGKSQELPRASRSYRSGG